MNRQLSTKTFIFTQILILILGLTFLYGLYNILNQDQTPKYTYTTSGKPVTSTVKSLNLELSQPEDDLLTDQETAIVSGKTQPNLEVLISSSQNIVIKSKSDGSFSTVIDLKEGANLITVVVFDSSGDQQLSARSIYYSKEKL